MNESRAPSVTQEVVMIRFREVGRVVALFRYPVKSMAACAVSEADVSWHGLGGDRRWAFIREGQVRSGFPWLTLRERSDMNHYQPSFVEPDRPNASATVVRTPAGRVLDVTDPELAAELGAGVRVIKQDRGVFDTMPLSMITRQTLDALGERAGVRLDVLRFRPNLVVDSTSETLFPEDEWVGRVLRIGSARMRVDQRDRRCVIVNIEPATTARNAEVLRAIARERGGALGVYGSTVEPGRVTVGDAVIVEEN
jgi:hypothetical protein